MKEKGVIQSTILITILSVVTIVFSFITQLFIAYYFGTSSVRDSYFAVLVIPTYISSVIVGSIGVMFLPIYVDVQTKEGEQKAKSFLCSTLTFSCLFSVVIAVLGIFFSKQLISITVPGFRGDRLELTSNLLGILMPTIGFQVITNIVSSVLQIKKKFVLPALAPVVSALINLVCVCLLNSFVGIYSLAYGTLIGSLIPAVWLLACLYREKNTKFNYSLKNNDLGQLLRTSTPLLLAGVFYRSNTVVERFMASTLPEGSISYLGYANQIMVILATLVSTGVATIIYPLLSRAWSENNLPELRELFIKGTRIIFLLTLPISVIFLFWGIPIFKILFERGAFTHVSTIAVNSTFSFLVIAFIANSLGSIIAKVFYLSQRTILGSFLEVLSTVVYIILAYFLSYTFSYKGLALATSLYTVVSISSSFIFLYYTVKGLDVRKIAQVIVVAIISSVIPLLIIEGLLKLLRLEGNFSFIVLVVANIAFLILYVLFLKAFKIKEIEELISQIKQRISFEPKLLKLE